MVAVTGTNGKTSVASFTRQIWEALGEVAVNFGNGRASRGRCTAPLGHTTPEPITLHRAARRPRGQGRDARARWRRRPTASTSAGSTGCAWRRRPSPTSRRDHLDYHLDFEAYFAAKLGLFDAGAAARRDGGHQPRRSARPAGAPDRQGAGAAAAHRGPGRGLHLRVIGQRFDADRAGTALRLGRAEPQGAARPHRRLSGAQRPGGGRARHRLGQRGGGGARGAAAGCARCAGGWRRRRRAPTARRSSSTTPIRRTRWHGAQGAAAARDGAADRGLRRRRRPRPRQAADDGRGGGRGGGRGLSSPTTTRGPRTPRRSARRCRPARRRRPRSATGRRRS